MTDRRYKNRFANCELCGKQFRMRMDSYNKYCSRICYFKTLKGRSKSIAHRKAIAKANSGQKHPWMLKEKNSNWRHDLDTNKIIKMYKQGYSTRFLAKKFKTEKSTIASRLRKAGIKIRRRVCRPSSPEIYLTKIIKDNNLPFEYTGDGKFWVGFKCPDFIHKTAKKIVEVFGRAFHDPNFSRCFVNVLYHQQFKGCQEYYKSQGYNILILWEEEVYKHSVVKKLRSFAYES